jgi:hypothetical protein
MPTNCCNDNGAAGDLTQQIVIAIDGIKENAAKIATFTNGTESQSVNLGGVETKTLRALVYEATNSLDGYVTLAANSAVSADVSKNVAELKAEETESAAGAAGAFASLSQRWAENPTGELVIPGQPGFSAKHWAEQAFLNATGSEPSSPARPGFAKGGGSPGDVYAVNSDGTAHDWLAVKDISVWAQSGDGQVERRVALMDTEGRVKTAEPLDTLDAATKAYVDSEIAALTARIAELEANPAQLASAPS